MKFILDPWTTFKKGIENGKNGKSNPYLHINAQLMAKKEIFYVCST